MVQKHWCLEATESSSNNRGSEDCYFTELQTNNIGTNMSEILLKKLATGALSVSGSHSAKLQHFDVHLFFKAI
ncbi:hypothetical protein ILYODFUR_005769 [Ilyodon furcidens]|uniref:Uncharacterized protein n=1 Tax=Ilyodon furcidens TaxID=33524 RepID=A0ABV0TGA7_9TELE